MRLRIDAQPNKQPDLFGAVEETKRKAPSYRRLLGDEFQFRVMSHLASLGVRSTLSPELASHDLIAFPIVKFEWADFEWEGEFPVSTQCKAKWTNAGAYPVNRYKKSAYDISAIGTKNGVYYSHGVPDKALSISNAQLLNAEICRQSWHCAVDAHLSALAESFRHPAFKGARYAPVF